jgi:hypothetical protein
MTPFFVGWMNRLPSRFAGMALAVGLGLPALGLGLGIAARDAVPPDFGSVPGVPDLPELPTEAAVTGLLAPGPVPLLHLPGGRTLMLSGDGKQGPGIDAALLGRSIAAEGFVLRRGTLEMLVLTAPPVPAEGAVPPPAVTDLGRWRISGEICDGKCAAGGMRPGLGLAHRACAVLCIDGGLPAVFVPTAPVAGHAFLLLADAAGGNPWPEFRALTAQRVTLEGQVERRGNILLFRAAPP